MTPKDLSQTNARALERILAVEPRWTAVRLAGEAIGLADRVLLHSDLAPVSDPGKLFPAGLYGLPAVHPGQ